jgi:hypothetical protein
MRLTQNEHHRKLRAPIGDTDVSGFVTPVMLASGYTNVLGLEDSVTFVPPTDCLLPPTTTCRLPRLQATSHGYLLPPMTTLLCALLLCCSNVELRRLCRR